MLRARGLTLCSTLKAKARDEKPARDGSAPPAAGERDGRGFGPGL